MNLQLFSAMRESERRRAIPSMTSTQYYDRHQNRDSLTGRDLLWVAACGVAVFVVVFVGLSF